MIPMYRAVARVPFDAEVYRLARFGDKLLHRRLGEIDERLVGQRLRPELDHAATRPIGAADSSLRDESGGLQRAQQPQCGARGELAIPGAVVEIRAASLADRREQREGALDRTR